MPSFSPLKLFAPAPRRPALAGAGLGGSMMFASTGDGGDYDFPDDDFPQEQQAPERRPRTTRPSRGGGDGGRQRTVQFQPEERYWTDYLRIALPVIGLLLMIGLLWFWAQQIISDEPKTTEPNATEDLGLVTTITPAPTQAQIVSTPPAQDTNAGATDQTQGQTPNQQQAQPTAAPTQPAGQTTGGDNQANAQETPAATEAPSSAGGIAVDTKVTVTEVLRMRAEPNTNGEIVTELPVGATLDVIGGPQESENYTWWNVVDENGNSGWVVENYIKPAS